MTTVHGRIVTPDKIVDGGAAFEQGIITQVGHTVPSGGKDYDFGDALVLPGFIDVHMHGLGEHGVFAAEELAAVAAEECRFGTTGFLPTIASLSVDDYLLFGRNVRKAQAEAVSRRAGVCAKNPAAAEIIGAHFEGPFINPRGKGGMDEMFLRPADYEECRRYLDESGDALKLMTLSPELEGAAAIVALLRRHGVIASLGHSRATVAELHAAVETGVRHVCHLFNGFERSGTDPDWPWLKGPENGLLDAIMADHRLSCEVVCDLVHVRPEHVRLAAHRLDEHRFIAITDSLPGAGSPPGEYTMVDGRRFTTASGAARLTANGVLVGSTLTMNRAFGNLVEQCGIDAVTAARYTSTNAAAALGLGGKLGSITPGRRACLTVLDSSYDCLTTFCDGSIAYRR